MDSPPEVTGAFLVDSGLVDRDTYLVARDLATRVARAVERDAVSARGARAARSRSPRYSTSPSR